MHYVNMLKEMFFDTPKTQNDVFQCVFVLLCLKSMLNFARLLKTLETLHVVLFQFCRFPANY